MVCKIYLVLKLMICSAKGCVSRPAERLLTGTCDVRPLSCSHISKIQVQTFLRLIVFFNLIRHLMLKLLFTDADARLDRVTKAKPWSFYYQLKSLMLNLSLSIKKWSFKRCPCRILCRIYPIYCQYFEIGKKMTGPFLTWLIGPLSAIFNRIRSMNANTS